MEASKLCVHLSVFIIICVILEIIDFMIHISEGKKRISSNYEFTYKLSRKIKHDVANDLHSSNELVIPDSNVVASIKLEFNISLGIDWWINDTKCHESYMLNHIHKSK